MATVKSRLVPPKGVLTHLYIGLWRLYLNSIKVYLFGSSYHSDKVFYQEQEMILDHVLLRAIMIKTDLNEIEDVSFTALCMPILALQTQYILAKDILSLVLRPSHASFFFSVHTKKSGRAG